MSTPNSNILQGFRNFSGITIGERKKELSFLLKECEGLIQSPVDIDHLIQNLKPTTYFEQKMFVNILLHFRREKELLTIFLGGNEKLIKALWKQIWFFKKLLENSSIESLIDQIFPHLSYVCRIRFLKNVIHYTSDEAKIDKLYDIVLDKYGSSNAQHVFAGCSLEKKMNSLTSGHVIKLSNKHLIFIYKNKREHFKKFMENYFRTLDFYDYHSKAFTVIAGSDENLLIEIFKANRCSTLGKRLSKKILRKEMSYIVEKECAIYKKIHQRTLLKCLRSNFEDFFFSTWPSSFKTFRLYTCFSLMKFYPKIKYVDLIQRGLQKLYKTSLSENPDLISDELLGNTKNIQVRESLLELRMQNSKNEYTLPKYYGIEKSIPILKKKISAADGVRTRENLIAALVKTCKINNDLNALLEVQKYFNFRHKNDDETIRSTFLYEIKSFFHLSSLTEEHWKLLFELLKWNIMKSGFFGAGDFYMLHIKYLYKNEAEEEVINELLMNGNYMTEILKCFSTSWKLIDCVPKLQKYFLQLFMKPLPLSCFDITQKTDLYFEIFKVILVWNKKCPNDNVNYCLSPEIKESIKTTLQKPCKFRSANVDYLMNFIKGKIQCEDKQFLLEIEQIFWKNLSDKFNTSTIEYYLRNRPLSIVEHFDIFISSMQSAYSCDYTLTIWRLLKYYTHLELVEKVIQHLVYTTTPNMHGDMGIGVATLLQSEEYTKFMLTFKTGKLDVDNEQHVKNYHLAMDFLRNAKYNDSPTVLPCVVQFCEGDSLREALAPLYYYFQHSPEKYLLEHLTTLSDRAVSVRKHAIKLACTVLPVEIVYTLIKQMTEAEKNQSVIEHMYWKTFKYFLVDRSTRFWSLLELQLNSLDISESNAFKESCNIGIIPKEFRQLYIDFIWKLLEDREKQGIDVSDFKESLIRSLSPEMFEELSYDFCSTLVKQKFLQFGNKSERTVRLFVLDCLKYSSHKELLLSDVIGVITEFKKNYILHPELKISCKSRPYLDDFISSIFYSYRNYDFEIIKVFYDNWTQIFTPTEDIQNYVRFTLLVHLNGMFNLENYVLKIAELFNNFLNEFGIFGMIDCFKDAVYYLLPNDVFCTEDSDEKIYKLAFKLSELGNPDLNLLAITLMPHNTENDYCLETQKKLIEIFKKSNDKSVLINLNLYIKSLGD